MRKSTQTAAVILYMALVAMLHTDLAAAGEPPLSELIGDQAGTMRYVDWDKPRSVSVARVNEAVSEQLRHESVLPGCRVRFSAPAPADSTGKLVAQDKDVVTLISSEDETPKTFTRPGRIVKGTIES